MKAEIFDYICSRIAYDWHLSIVASTEISKHFNITLYRARKIIKQLVADGLLASKIEVLYSAPWEDDDWYPPRIYRGYALTKAGYETECYKKHYREMCDYWNNVCKGVDNNE